MNHHMLEYSKEAIQKYLHHNGLIYQFHHFQISSSSTYQNTSYNGQEGNEKTESLENAQEEVQLDEELKDDKAFHYFHINALQFDDL